MPIGIYKHQPMSEETKKKISIANKGKGHPVSEETKRKISKGNKGKIVPLETRIKMGISRTGAKHWNWKGGIATYKRKIYLNARRRARKRDAEGSHTEEEWQNLKYNYKYTCPACLRKEPEITLSEDHIIPLSKNGSDYISNIQPLCRGCNSKKLTKEIKYEFAIT